MIRRLTALVAMLALVLAGCSSGRSARQGGQPSDLAGGSPRGQYQGAGLDPPQPRPSFTLTDADGKPFAFATNTGGRPTLLYFGYTHCPDVCPTTMADISIALKHVPAAVAKQTYVVFVSTDVKRDTGPVLKKWISNFSDGSRATFVALRGSQIEIDAAQAAAHVLVAEDGGATHSSQVLLYGTDDYARVAFLQSTAGQTQIAHDLPLVAQA